MKNKRKIKRFWAELIRVSKVYQRTFKISFLITFLFLDISEVPKTPYSIPWSIKFFKAVKKGNRDEVSHFLYRNKHLVHEYDYIKQTALHWAAKRDFPDIIKILLHYGAYIDAKDSCNRTPLYLASRAGNVRSVKALLAEHADTKIKIIGSENRIDGKLQHLNLYFI